MARADKAAAVAELAEEFRSSSASVLTEYRGLTVGQLAELRRTLGAGTTYSIVKNTLTKLAAKEAGVEAFEGLLVGPSAIAFVKGDPVEAAKGLRDFAKAHPLLVIKGGVLDGKTLDAAELTKLADLESREVLLAKLAGAFKAKTSQAAALFQAPLSKAVRTVDALRAKVAEGAPADEASTVEAGTDEAGTDEASTDESSTDEVSTEATDEAGTDEAGTDEASAE